MPDFVKAVFQVSASGRHLDLHTKLINSQLNSQDRFYAKQIYFINTININLKNYLYSPVSPVLNFPLQESICYRIELAVTVKLNEESCCIFEC